MVCILNPQQKITQELLNLEQLELAIDIYAQKSNFTTQTILKLRYETTLSNAPNLTEIAAVFDQPIYLYQSHVDSIQGYLIGSFIIAVQNTHLDLTQLSKQLKPQIAHIEVLGYAKSID